MARRSIVASTRSRRARMLAVVALALAVVASGPGPVDPDPARADTVVEPIDDGGLRVPGAEFVPHGTTWSTTQLTWGFQGYTTKLSAAAQRGAIGAALETWSAVTPLTFTEVDDCGLPFDAPACVEPDIRILFGAGGHGAGGTDPDFDGPGGTAAHAYYPPPNGYSAAGDVHFDNAESWSTGGGGVDLQTVALHELGHALGLEHAPPGACSGSPSPNRPIMCATIIGVDRTLAPDDVAGIQSLYGDPLPVELDIELAQAGVAEAGAAIELAVTIENGLHTDLTGAAIDVDGVDGCDEPALPDIPARTVYGYSCPLPDEHLLVPFTTGHEVAVGFTFTAAGIEPVVVDPAPLAIVAPDHPFSDVPGWVEPAVDWIAWYELATGYPNGTYRPDHPITRAQVTRMVHRLGGSTDTGHQHPFGDVDPWVDDAVDWANDPAGPAAPDPLMSGYPDVTFRPDARITRAEVVRLLHRFAGSPDGAGLPDHGFGDVPPWVDDAVRWAAHDHDGSGPMEPIATGYPDATFRPGADISRAQATRMLYRLAEVLDL